MTTDAPTTITEQNGMLIGPYRSPRNLAASERGSIHDDATAQKLGFRGGTVAGSIHMEQFPPILMRAFGQQWFETGSISTYFRNATTDGEPVRPLVQMPAPGATQVNIFTEKEDGTQVLEGTASIGGTSEPSLLRRKLAEPRESGELRLLDRISPGDDIAPIATRCTHKDADPRVAVVTEPLPWYSGDSPWGDPILNPGLVVHIMVAAQRNMRLPADAVGLYGAIEVRHLRGPVFLERDYEVRGTILATGSTPKTEYVWFETHLREPSGLPLGGVANVGLPLGGVADAGPDVASMIMMLRFMKASSPRWRDA